METLSVRCNHCGAPLAVAEHTRFVTCQFCHSSLEVRRTDSTIFTEEVGKIAANTGRMAESLEAIQLQNEIERLDREHVAMRLSSPAKKDGAAGVIALVMVIAFGGFFAVGSAQHGAPWIFQLFGGGFALIGIIKLAQLLGTNASSKEAKPTGYEQRRAELTRKLDELTQN